MTGVDFVPVPTRDLERAAELLRHTLGLQRSVYMPERDFAEFETGNLTLERHRRARKWASSTTSTRNAIALHVDDVAAARAQLEAGA